MSLLTATNVASRNPAEIFAAAEQAAVEAGKVANANLPPEAVRGLDCGFAWVTVKPATGPFVNWCRKNGQGSKAYNGGWQFWKPGHVNTQSISVHEAAAKAFRDVLVANGVNHCEVGTKYD